MLFDAEHATEARLLATVAGRSPWDMLSDLATRRTPGVRFGQAVIALGDAFARRRERRANPLPANVVEFRPGRRLEVADEGVAVEQGKVLAFPKTRAG